MIKITDKRDCCGCGACVQSCPKNCISMKTDEEGFVYPAVDESVCIGCGLCEKVCPILNEITDLSTKGAYAACSNEDSRLTSSSGGLFTLFAEKIIEEGGVVCGAAFDDDFLVHHVIVESVADLELLRGSKYVQSSTGDVFIRIKDYLKTDRKVLFTGTACQVAGLKRFLGRDYDNLYTIDILCHGVPSPAVWRKYLDYLKEKEHSNIKNVNFRDKVVGWHDFSLTVNFENGHAVSETFLKDKYMKMFLGNYILRPSCYKCRFKDISRASDLSIGDAWGVENIFPELDDNKGTSVAIVHTDKGISLMEEIKEHARVCEAEVDKILPPSADSRKSVAIPGGREWYFFNFKKGKTVDKLLECMKPNFKNKVIRQIIKNKF